MKKIDTKVRAFIRLLKQYFSGEIHIEEVIEKGRGYGEKTINQTVDQLQLMRDEGELTNYYSVNNDAWPPF